MQVRPRTRIARRLRRNATEAETPFWWLLRDGFPGVRFRRQHPVGRFIVDFACPAHKLAIELDGSQHAAQETEDQSRTAELARYGYRVIRFWDNDVFQNPEGVLATIEGTLAQFSAGAGKSPSPPSRGEREGPSAQRCEVGIDGNTGERPGIPRLTPTLSTPRGGEGAATADSSEKGRPS